MIMKFLLDSRLLEIAKSCERDNDDNDNDDDDDVNDVDDDDDLDEDYEPEEDMYPAQIQKHEQQQQHDFQLSQQQQQQQRQPEQNAKNVEIKKESVQNDSVKQKFFTSETSFVFADKSAKVRSERKELMCSMCGFKCVTEVLMTSHTILAHAGQGPGMVTSCSRYVTLPDLF